jgi:lipid II:glycine glycyltransferase (peptidoglycan interpeptide bridge formation enzyme)
MPNATIVFDLSLDEKQLLKNFSKTAKRHVNKAKKANATFKIAK